MAVVAAGLSWRCSGYHTLNTEGVGSDPAFLQTGIPLYNLVYSDRMHQSTFQKLP